MLVETYEVTEVDGDGNVECDAEAMRLIEELGLEGQQKLINPDTATRTPYRKMTAEEKWVIEQTCPKKTAIHKYADAPIPVRVLQVAAHAKDLFANVYVWHPANADEKDPYLVGVNQVGTATEFFLLARWGEELMPWKKMVVKAGSAARAAILAKLKSIASEVKVRLAEFESMSPEEVAAKKATPPSYYNF